jgi:hypothetical protein
MDTWQFFQNDAGLWCWKRIDPEGVLSENGRCFDSRTDCIVDAMKHGYLSEHARRAKPVPELGSFGPWR